MEKKRTHTHTQRERERERTARDCMDTARSRDENVSWRNLKHQQIAKGITVILRLRVVIVVAIVSQ